MVKTVGTTPVSLINARINNNSNIRRRARLEFVRPAVAHAYITRLTVFEHPDDGVRSYIICARFTSRDLGPR